MENSVWRPRARIVAIVDLVLIILGTVIIILFAALFGAVVSHAAKNGSLNATLYDMNETQSTEPPPDVTSMAYWILGITVVVCILVVALQIWAAVKLLKAGRMGEEPAKALDMALFWRNMTIVMCIITVIGYVIRLNILGLIILIVWRGISFYVVFNFIDELRSYLNSGNYQPDSVITRK